MTTTNDQAAPVRADAAGTGKPDPQTVPLTFIRSLTHARKELAVLASAERVAIDTETVIVRDENGKAVDIDFDVDIAGPWRVMSIAARVNGTDHVWVLDMKHVNAREIADLFGNIRPWGWNTPFDKAVLKRDGITIHDWTDAMLYDAVLKQGAYWATGGRAWYTSLEDAGRRYLGLDGIEGKTDTRLNYTMEGELSDAEQRYAADDAVVTLWLSYVLEEAVAAQDLTASALRNVNAQSFIDGMGKAGLPLDVPGYQAKVDEAKARAAEAAEKIALATTGKEMLTTVARWVLRRDGVAVTDLTDELIHEHGLKVLRDEHLFGEFITAVRAQLGVCREEMARLTGAKTGTVDLFSETGVSHELPFDPDDETTIRRWLSKTAKVFVAEFIASVGGSNKQLVKAHDLNEVYHALATSQAADVTDELRELAVVLASYKRYAKILADYAGVVAPVHLKPDWNISSDPQVKEMLNTYSLEHVHAFTAAKDGYPRPLGQADSVDKDALALIGGPLCTALLEYRKQEKIVTTYGDDLINSVHPATGRIHGKYTQALTGTGRLASYSPNMQNLSPLAKPYLRPPLAPNGTVRRVLVCSDLSQAELRFVADMSQDRNMLEAFWSGEDLHERTASLMNNLDMKALKAAGEAPLSQLTSIEGLGRFIAERPDLPAFKLYKELRSKAKAVAFGYAYGLKGASLAKQLTVMGVPTTKEEADELLAKFDLAYPQLAAWMQQRVDFIKSLSEAMKDQSRPSGCDFELSWRLHRLYAKANSARKALKNKLGRWPTHVEIATELVSDEDLTAALQAEAIEVTPEVIAERRQGQASQVAWALGHYGSAVLAADGTPWSFESRTLGGSRRLFQVGTKDWVLAMCLIIAGSRRKHARDLTDAWVAEYNKAVLAEYEKGKADGTIKGNTKAKTVELRKLDPSTRRMVNKSREELEKVFGGADGEQLKISFLSYVLDAYSRERHGEVLRDALFRAGMADRIRAMSNQYRNHPIQGGVADAVLDAYAKIDRDLREQFPTAVGVQSVHDSIVVECDLIDAPKVRDLVVRHMEESLAAYCPNVPCKADGDIQLSLDDATIVTGEKYQELVSQLALAA